MHKLQSFLKSSLDLKYIFLSLIHLITTFFLLLFLNVMHLLLGMGQSSQNQVFKEEGEVNALKIIMEENYESLLVKVKLN